MRTVPYENIGIFDLAPGFYVSGGDPMAAYDGDGASGRCDNHCVFCLQGKFVEGEGAPFPETPTRPRVDIGNWEPTALPDLSGKVKALRKRYEQVAVFTNGRRLDAACSRSLAEAGAGEVVVSLHGPSPAVHDALTKVRGSFDEAVAGCRNFVAAAKGRSQLGISLVSTHSNLPHLGAVLDLSVALGARVLYLSLIVPLGAAKRSVKKYGPSPAQAFAALAALASERGGKSDIVVHLIHMPVCIAEAAYARDVSVVLTPRRGAFDELLSPAWVGRCAACRWAPWCEGMMEAYAS